MVSVIVPIYNVSVFLRKCIESITSQTYKDIEIILVDDGSTDDSGIICDEFAARDMRVKVIHKDNGGLVSARKAGITSSSGDYILYVDGDDYIDNDLILTLISNIIETSADIVETGYYIDIEDKKYPVNTILNEGIYESKDIAYKVLSDSSTNEAAVSPFLWSKLWNRNILIEHQMRADERICVAEDVVVTYPAIFDSDKISVVNYKGYHYVQHDKSMTGSYGKNEAEGVELVIDYLLSLSEKYPQEYVVLDQIHRFERLQYLTRCFEKLEGEGTILKPFGGIPINSEVIIYGAGHFGRSVFNYLKNRNDIKIKCIVDKNYERYINRDFSVESVDILGNLVNCVDYIIVTIINKKVVSSIMDYLVGEGYSTEQIKIVD